MMSNRRGRPSLKQSLIGQAGTSGRCGPPAFQLKRINADTLSVHDVNTEDEEDLLSSPIPSVSSVVVRSKTGPKPKEKANNASDINQLLLSIKADTAATRAEMKSTRNELKNDIHQLSQRTEAKINVVNKQLALANSDIKTLFSKVKEMESMPNVSPTNIELHKQNKLRNNITISNVPVNPNENLYDIVRSILILIGIPNFKVDDLEVARRVPGSRSSLIIAGFRDYAFKADVMKKKSSKMLKVSDIFDLQKGDANSRLYINNHLTPFYSKLSFHGRQALYNRLIHSCWVSSNGFLVRLNENSNPIVINGVSEFDEFLKTNGRIVQKKRERSMDSNPSPSTIRAAKQHSAPITQAIEANLTEMDVRDTNGGINEGTVATAIAQTGGNMEVDLTQST